MIVGVRRAPARERDFSAASTKSVSFFGKSHKSSQVMSVNPAPQLQNLTTFESQTRKPKAPKFHSGTLRLRDARGCVVCTPCETEHRAQARATWHGPHGTGGGGRVSSSSGLSRTPHSLTSTLLRDGHFASLSKKGNRLVVHLLPRGLERGTVPGLCSLWLGPIHPGPGCVSTGCLLTRNLVAPARWRHIRRRSHQTKE